jgi:hypothetical protein
MDSIDVIAVLAAAITVALVVSLYALLIAEWRAL